MPDNVLLTGPPGIGKSTVLDRAASRLRDQGYEVTGLISPELRDAEGRVGFRIVDLATGADAVMAHVDNEEGPSVGKYRVDVAAVDRISEQALGTARRKADVVLIDEIAPMETHSDIFVTEVRACLDSELPVVGTVHERSTSGFISEVKARSDVELLTVDRRTREALPAELSRRVLDRLDG